MCSVALAVGVSTKEVSEDALLVIRSTSGISSESVEALFLDFATSSGGEIRSTSVTRSSLLVFWAVEVSIGVTRSISLRWDFAQNVLDCRCEFFQRD